MTLADFTTEAFTLLGVGIIVIGLRTAARWTSAGIKNFMLDDYVIILAAIVYTLETLAAYTVGARFHGLANNGMTPAQRTALLPTDPEYALRVGGSKTQVVGWSLYTLLLWLLKLCMNVFYSRLTAGLDHMVPRVRWGYVFVGATYVATIGSILLGCRPLERNWQIEPDPGNKCQPAISKINLYVTVVLNVVTDMYLMSIPLPMLWSANLPPRRKYLLLVMFSGGIFVMMAGILRCVLILTDPVNGAQQAGSWACRETFVAVIIGNVPMIYPLFRRLLTHLGLARASRPYVDSAKLPEWTPDGGKSAGSSKKVNSVYPLSEMGGTVLDHRDLEQGAEQHSQVELARGAEGFSGSTLGNGHGHAHPAGKEGGIVVTTEMGVDYQGLDEVGRGEDGMGMHHDGSEEGGKRGSRTVVGYRVSSSVRRGGGEGRRTPSRGR